MGFLKQTGKRKKREQKSFVGEPVPELEQATQRESELEKTMFLSPEERTGSKKRGAKRISTEGVEAPDSSPGKIVQGNPIIINGPDYLLRISETRMEAFLLLYRRFSEKELRELLKENGIVYGIREKALEELAQGKLNYEEVFVAQGTAKKDGRDGYFEYHFNTEPETKPIILPDGSVDYNVLGKMELVTKGQLLVTYHAVLPAVVGRDVQGNTMEAYEGKELPPLQ
ncbi:MAG: FapA family protein, partial [Lachnospiraceae bacterium]|nr:FapA family protein [Lachnospiraceae bacterium]